MKKLLILLPLLVLAWGCNRNTGVQEITYPAAQNAPVNKVDPTAAGDKIPVNIAVIALDDAGKHGEKIGCNDSVVYLTRYIPKTVQPLNEALRQLFGITGQIVPGTETDQEYYSVIPLMTQLKFDHATLDDAGLAKIYLTGSMAGLGGVCDSPRVPAQIEGTAKQFGTVKTVETYLNGKKVDWKAFQSQK